MKIEIEITPEEFKELFIPGEKQQEFARQLWTEYQKNMMSNTTEVMRQAAADFWDPAKWQR